MLTGAGEHLANARLPFGDQMLDFLIDPRRGGVAVLATLRQLIPEKRLFIITRKGHGAEAVPCPSA